MKKNKIMKTENKHRFPYKWTLKDAVFTKDKGKVFSCFACGGGSTMGYKLAGFDVLGCNEIDPKMIEAYKANHDPKYAYLEPIQTFKLRTDLPSELYNLDILDGSPPCSSFSMAGNREKDWGKDKVFREGQAMQVLDTLFFDFIDLAKKLQPKVVVAENVKGLLLGDAIQYVRQIYREFDLAGYYCQHWLLDASKMGVPQKRERVFFIAMRKDLAEPFLYQQDMFTVNPLLKLEFNEPEILFKEIENLFGENKPLQERLYPNFDYCISKNIKDFAKYNEDVEGKRANFNWRLSFNNQTPDTITSGAKLIKEDKTYMNVSELCQIGSYPLDYNFLKNPFDYLIGMSVPPVMTAQIATEIYEQWLSKIAL
jgi:DNA (cytosine-5)-methyltransferase 1